MTTSMMRMGHSGALLLQIPVRPSNELIKDKIGVFFGDFHLQHFTETNCAPITLKLQNNENEPTLLLQKQGLVATHHLSKIIAPTPRSRRSRHDVVVSRPEGVAPIAATRRKLGRASGLPHPIAVSTSPFYLSIFHFVFFCCCWLLLLLLLLVVAVVGLEGTKEIIAASSRWLNASLCLCSLYLFRKKMAHVKLDYLL